MSLAQVQAAAMIPVHRMTAAVPHFYPSLGTGNVGAIKGGKPFPLENTAVLLSHQRMLVSVCGRRPGGCGPVCVAILCISSITPRTLM